MDYSILAKLEAEAGHSRKLQEPVRLLRAVHARLQEAKPATAKPAEDDQGPDVQQLAAQVVYLDKKIIRLREKVKRKALETTNGDPGLPTGVDVSTASAAELQRELAALRAAKARREAESNTAPSCSPRSPSSPSRPKAASRSPERSDQAGREQADMSNNQKALKKRLAHFQSQMKELAAEKEAADANTKKVRELAEAVEQRLRETVLTREAERIKLEAEQELLRRRLEEQQEQISDLEGPTVQPDELDALEAHLAEVEKNLAAVREKARRESLVAKEISWDPCSGASSPRHTPQLLSEAAAPSGAPTAPPTPARSEPQAPAWPPLPDSAEYEQLMQSRSDAERDLAQTLEELERARAVDAERQRALEEELVRVRNEAFQAENQLRKELADAAERRCNELTDQAKALKAAWEEEQQVAQAAVEAASRELEELKASHKAALQKARAEADARLAYEESQLAQMQDDAVELQRQHVARVRRQNGLLRRFHLALRPQNYRRQEFLHYVSCSLGVPSGALRIVSETFVPEAVAAHHDLVLARGEPIPLLEEPIDALVRDLPELCRRAQRGAADEKPDALDAALEEAKAEDDVEGKSEEGKSEDGVEAKAADDGEITGRGDGASAAGVAADAMCTAGAGTLTLPDGYVLRVEVELVPGNIPVSGGQTAELACNAAIRRLADIIRRGGSLLEDLALLGLGGRLGRAAFAEAAAWRPGAARLLRREARGLEGRDFVITLYGIAEPMAVQLAAISYKSKEEYILCFDREDLRVLVGDDLTLGDELADKLLDALRLVPCIEDDKTALVAILVAAAPQTAVNALQLHPEGGLPFMLELTKALPALPAPPSLGAAPAAPQQLALPAARKEEPASRPMPPPYMKVVPLTPDLDDRICRLEDVILFEDRFFLLAISQDKVAGTVNVQLQEAGACGGFEASLPGRPRHGKPYSRQLRAFTQAYEFRRLTLLLAIEDIPEPPALVVRVARGDPTRPLAWQDPDQKVYWFSCDAADEVADDAVVEIIPSRHRERLLDFVHAELSRGVGSSGGANGNPRPGGRFEQEYGSENNCRTGLVLRDPHSHKPFDSMENASAAAQLLEASMQTGGRLLLKVGRQIPTHLATSKLCVLTVREHVDPYLHFTITAFEIGTCSSWALLVDSLEVFRKLDMHTSSEVRDVGERRELARQLTQRCQLVNDAAGGLCLELADAPAPRAGRGPEAGAEGAGADTGEATAALQALSQAEAAEYVADARRYCILRAQCQLTDHSLDVRIYDEPDAPEAAFLINNFLIIAHDAARCLFFSLRVHDRALHHPLEPEDLHLLEPENRKALLERLLASLDLCTSVQQSGSSGQRLVIQPMRIWKVPPLAPDATGVLRPLDPKAACAVGASGGDPGAETAALGSSAGGDLPSDGPLALEGGVPQLVKDLEEPRAAVQIGSCVLEDDASALDVTSGSGRSQLAQKQGRLGNSDVELLLETDARGHAHIFVVRLLEEAGGHLQAAVEVQIPAWGEPTRVYLEHRCVAGRPLLLAVAQQAFPHEVQAMAFDPKTHEELDVVARDNSILPFVERSIRERLGDALEQLAKFGALGAADGSVRRREVASGRELFPSDATVRALQNHVPVLSVNFSKLAHEVPSDLVTSRELLFSCSRYVVSPELLASIGDGPEASIPAGLDLNTVPKLRISLSKKTYCQDFTLFIEKEGGDEASHMVDVRDKLTTRPMGMFAEIRKLGDLRLLVLLMDDCAPRALRIAVVEPSSGWSFQLIVADTSSADNNPSYLAAYSPRHELLQLFRRRFGARRGLPAPGPAAAPMQLPAASQAQHLKRETRFLANDAAVVITVSYEVPSEGDLRLKAILLQATPTKETQLLLVNPGLDRILEACGLAPSAQLDPEELLQEPARGDVAKLALSAIEVLPSLEMELRMERLPRAKAPAPAAAEPPPLQHSPRATEGRGAQTPGGGSTATALQPPVLECKEEELLAQASRTSDGEPVELPQANTGEEASQGSSSGSGKTKPKVGFHVEVFDGSDCVQALFHSTNLRVRVTDFSSGYSAVRDLHEDELEPWLGAAGAGHLLCASREVDLVDMIVQHAALGLPEGTSGTRGVILEALRGDTLSSSRFAASLLASVEAGPQPAAATMGASTAGRPGNQLASVKED